MEGVACKGVTDPNSQCKRELELSYSKGKSPLTKKRRFTSSKNFKPRLGGSSSDPLNLEVWSDDHKCPTCPTSPVGTDRNLGDQSHIPLPKELHHDPLNLEEKISDFEQLIGTFNQIRPTTNKQNNNNNKDRRKRKYRNRQKSQSVSSNCDNNPCSSSSSYNPKAAPYRYGNYDRYYSYRNNGMLHDDPRLKLFNKEWFVDKTCLDIGCNTGQVTIELGKLFAPKHVKGIDIDNKLVRTASKNLNRSLIPTKLPDGRPIPLSIVMSFGPIDWSTEKSNAIDGEFPHNVTFVQENYVPFTDDVIQPEYDVILCLSVTKWIHLNYGDQALKRTFKKIYQNLQPNGRLILEPQPWESYGRRKKLSVDIFENYQNIEFFPDQFHDYLMSAEVGFSKHQYIGTPVSSLSGFERPIHTYIKEIPPTEQ